MPYLRHHPLIAFARLLATEDPRTGKYLALIALAFEIANLSWRFIETPARDSRWREMSNSEFRTLSTKCAAVSICLFARQLGGGGETVSLDNFRLFAGKPKHSDQEQRRDT